MNRAAVPVVLAFVLVGTRTRSLDAPQNDPFSFFAPTIQISADDRKHLAAGDAIAKILPARDHELAILAEGSTTATAEMPVNSARHIATLNKSPFVPRVGRFSKQPGLRDVAMLTLDRIDLDALKTCRPGACDPTLTTPGALALTLLAASESSSMHYLVTSTAHGSTRSMRSGDPLWSTV